MLFISWGRASVYKGWGAFAAGWAVGLGAGVVTAQMGAGGALILAAALLAAWRR